MDGYPVELAVRDPARLPAEWSLQYERLGLAS